MFMEKSKYKVKYRSSKCKKKKRRANNTFYLKTTAKEITSLKASFKISRYG